MEPKKKKRRCRIVSEEAATLIDGCRKFFERELQQNQRILLSRPVERTAAAFVIGESTVRQIREKLENSEPFGDDSRSRDMIILEYFVPIIRQAITKMYAAKKHVTLITLLAELQSERATRSTGWKWSRATLHRFLTTKLRYTYGNRPTYCQQLKENASIAAQRYKYIRKIKHYRAEGRPIFYQDETWASKNMTPVKVRVGGCGSGGLKVPSGKGERSIICHIGGSSGFVDGAKLIFRGSKSLKNSDYHTEMNSAVFLGWMEKRVLPSVPPKSILAIDRTSYHRTLTPESRPVKANSKKAELISWLIERNIEVDGMRAAEDYNKLTRPEMYKMCKANAPEPMFEMRILAQRYDCNVLFLPVGHPELNPIELVWSRLKGFIAQRNVNFSLPEVEKLAHEFVDSFDGSERKKYVEHCVKVEDEYLSAADDIELNDQSDNSSGEGA